MTMMNYEEGHHPQLIVVELHRHGASTPVIFSNGNARENALIGATGDIDVENCAFENIQWVSRTSVPYESLQISFRFTHREGDPNFQTVMTGPNGYGAGIGVPATNDWLVLKTFEREEQELNSSLDMQTVFFARVHSARGEMRVDPSTGAIDKSLLHVQAEGFMDFLARNHVLVGLVPTQGTMFNLKDWIDVKSQIIEEALNENLNEIVGKRFRTLFKYMGKVKLPESLSGGQTLGNSVTVVFNQNASNRVNGEHHRRNVEPVPGYRIQGIQNLDPSSGSALDLLLGSFMADPSMMEIFPSIETHSASPSKTNLNRSLAVGGTSLNPKACVIIRMKPWRPEGITSFAQRAASLVTNIAQIDSGAYADDYFKNAVLNEAKILAESISETVISEETLSSAQSRAFNKLANIGQHLPGDLFNKATWPESAGAIGDETMHFIEPSEIYSLTYEQNDAAHVNTVSARGHRQAASQLEFASAFMGLPFTNTTDIQEQGVRYYRPEWPFFHIKFGDDSEINDTVDERDFIRAVATAALQIHAAASRFLSGSIQMSYRPDLKVGMCFRAGAEVDSIGEHKTDFNKEPLPSSGQRQEGQLIGYIEEITHSIVALRDGGMRADTTIKYTRGLFNENRPPLGIKPQQAALPGESLKNGWHQRFIGFTHLRRYSGGFTTEDFTPQELEL